MWRRPALFLGVLRVLCGWFPAPIKKTAEGAEDAEDCSSFLDLCRTDLQEVCRNLLRHIYLFRP